MGDEGTSISASAGRFTRHERAGVTRGDGGGAAVPRPAGGLPLVRGAEHRAAALAEARDGADPRAAEALTEPVTAWVLCTVLGRDELVTCAPAQHRELEAGALRCPVCTLPCKPKMRAVGVLPGRPSLHWIDGSWRRDRGA